MFALLAAGNSSLTVLAPDFVAGGHFGRRRGKGRGSCASSSPYHLRQYHSLSTPTTQRFQSPTNTPPCPKIPKPPRRGKQSMVIRSKTRKPRASSRRRIRRSRTSPRTLPLRNQSREARRSARWARPQPRHVPLTPKSRTTSSASASGFSPITRLRRATHWR
ncbi:hypothetical protein C8F01DRAFT_86620 [Mycena amicta]|nr:hypothetical protein C8F01DRAFT_86620 [Mycena amicta]